MLAPNLTHASWNLLSGLTGSRCRRVLPWGQYLVVGCVLGAQPKPAGAAAGGAGIPIFSINTSIIISSGSRKCRNPNDERQQGQRKMYAPSIQQQQQQKHRRWHHGSKPLDIPWAQHSGRTGEGPTLTVSPISPLSLPSCPASASAVMPGLQECGQSADSPWCTPPLLILPL